MKVVNRKYKEYFSLALQRGIKAPHPKTPILFASSLNRQYLCTLVVFHFFVCWFFKSTIFVHLGLLPFFVYWFFKSTIFAHTGCFPNL